ncbi:MAG: DoxX family protein [Chloroflexota bacterium]
MVSKIIYWASTGIIAAMMLFAAYNYFTNEMMKGGFQHLGFPDYFRYELGAMKGLGALALILPFTPRFLKYFAYSGFTIAFISAFIAHTSVGDPISIRIMPVIYLALLMISLMYYRRHYDNPIARSRVGGA